MSEYVDALQVTRDRIYTLAGSLSEDQVAVAVPACPHWSIHDLIAHLAGLAVDFCGDLSTVMGPGFWDHAEVDRREIIPRRRASTSEVLDEWMAVSAQFEGVVASVEVPLAGGIVGDFICHEHDLRAAVGRPGERSSAEAQLGLDIYARSMARHVTAAKLPALVIRAGDREWIVGDGDPGATVSAEPFEMFRALTGRRTKEQVGAFEWTGNPNPYLGEFSMFEWPDHTLEE